jgi:hypothetical protein
VSGSFWQSRPPADSISTVSRPPIVTNAFADSAPVRTPSLNESAEIAATAIFIPTEHFPQSAAVEFPVSRRFTPSSRNFDPTAAFLRTREPLPRSPFAPASAACAITRAFLPSRFAVSHAPGATALRNPSAALLPSASLATAALLGNAASAAAVAGGVAAVAVGCGAALLLWRRRKRSGSDQSSDVEFAENTGGGRLMTMDAGFADAIFAGTENSAWADTQASLWE